VGLPGEALDIRYPDASARLNIDGFGGRTALIVWPPRR
jgi:hypothetical protein